MKLGSDAVGTVFGLLTIPMALLSLASIGAGAALAVRQDWAPLLLGLAALPTGMVLAHLLERLVVAIDRTAAYALVRGRRRRAHAVAFVSGALPMAAIFAIEIGVFGAVLAVSAAPVALGWLWGYGAATGPWTLFAERVSRFRRTLVGMRAYVGHVGLWLYALLALRLDAGPVVVVAALAAAAFISVTVGLLLALADRKAIANVRV